MLYIKNMILVRSVNVKIGNPAVPLEPPVNGNSSAGIVTQV